MDEAKSTSEFEQIKKTLLARKEELEQELVQLHTEKFSDDQVQDVGDQALSSTMESINSSFQGAKIDEYNRILKALKMIEDGAYGVCVDCDMAISTKRLTLFSNSTRCLSCQEVFEIG